MNYKNSFTLLELIFVVFVGSIFFAYTFIFTKDLYSTNKQNEKIAMIKLDLNSTKIIIERNIQLAKDSLNYSNNKLYLNNNLLLKNVTSFSKHINTNFLEINLTVDNSINQNWVFKL